MRLAFDHLVHFLQRPPAVASERFRQAGYHAVPGGRHASWGTWNSLGYFDLSYVEFLAVEVNEVAARSENPLIRQLVKDLQTGEGLGQIALRTDEMDLWAERLREKGLPVIGPVAGSRVRDDGTTIRWRMLFAEDPESELLPPFLIEWEQTDEERRKDLTQRGIIASHPNGARSLESVGYAVADLSGAARCWQHWFGLESGDAYYDEQWGAECRTIEVAGGNIVLCQPSGDGIAREALKYHGGRPFFARFAGSGTEQTDVIFGGMYQTIKS